MTASASSAYKGVRAVQDLDDLVRCVPAGREGGPLGPARWSASSRRASSAGSAVSQTTNPNSRRIRRFASRSTAPPPVARIAPGWLRRQLASASLPPSRGTPARPSSAKIRPDRAARTGLDLAIGVAGTAGPGDPPGSGRRSTCPCPGNPPAPGPDRVTAGSSAAGRLRHSSRRGPSLRCSASRITSIGGSCPV